MARLCSHLSDQRRSEAIGSSVPGPTKKKTETGAWQDGRARSQLLGCIEGPDSKREIPKLDLMDYIKPFCFWLEYCPEPEEQWHVVCFLQRKQNILWIRKPDPTFPQHGLKPRLTFQSVVEFHPSGSSASGS